MKKQVELTLQSAGPKSRPIILTFDLVDSPVTENWLKHVELFIAAGQPWDDPYRFYNFPQGVTRQDVEDRLRDYYTQIGPYLHEDLLDWPSVLDQDFLNYLHNIFERYHGLYGQQTTAFWLTAPENVQRALADLNIWIHRYETLGGIPRFVGTWRGKPDRYKFTDEDLAQFSLSEQWGDLRLNYCEIGKTLQDLAHDNDQYISDEAFQPMHHYCFDFTVRFSEMHPAYFTELESSIWNYYDQHQEFFAKFGYIRHDPRLALGSITIGRLRTNRVPKWAILDGIDYNQRLVDIRIVK